MADEITVRWTGVCPTVDGPVPASWSRAGSLIRLDTSVVVGGVPAPDVPYELLTDLGRLPSGSYRVELFLEVFVAPSLPAPEVPDAVLEFEVAGLAAVPTLDPRLLAFLAMLLAAVAVTFLRRL